MSGRNTSEQQQCSNQWIQWNSLCGSLVKIHLKSIRAAAIESERIVSLSILRLSEQFVEY